MEKLRQISMLTAVAFALALGFALLPAPRAQAGIVSLTAASLCQSLERELCDSVPSQWHPFLP